MVREEERILTISDFGLRASFTKRYDPRILSARTHSCTLKHSKQFFPKHSTEALVAQGVALSPTQPISVRLSHHVET